MVSYMPYVIINIITRYLIHTFDDYSVRQMLMIIVGEIFKKLLGGVKWDHLQATGSGMNI